MKKINFKLMSTLCLGLFMVGCSEELSKPIFGLKEETEKTSPSLEKIPESTFEISVNSAVFQESVDTGDNKNFLPSQEGVQYLILNTAFKNTGKENRFVEDEKLVGRIDGKEYIFTRDETFTIEGWGKLKQELIPGATKETRLVYKVPEVDFQELYLIPDKNAEGNSINLLDKISQKVKEEENELQPLEKGDYEKNQIGSTISTDFFHITLESLEFSKDVITENPLADLFGDGDSLFATLEVNFKNLDSVSRKPQEGYLVLNYEGKDYRYPQSEIINLKGWGAIQNEINPLINEKTRLVFKLPKKEPDFIVYIPEKNSVKKGFLVYSKKTVQPLPAPEEKPVSPEKPVQLPSLQPIPNSQRKLVYSLDDIYTYLIWRGYVGEHALEHFKADHGLPPNTIIDERVLDALGMEIRYKD